MLEKSFIEYLLEKSVTDKNGNILYYIIPKNIQKGTKEVDDLVECLISCLHTLSKEPSNLTISPNQRFNKPTIEYILNQKNIDINNAEIKRDVLNYILNLDLKHNFNKFEHSKSHNTEFAKGWICVFNIANRFKIDPIKSKKDVLNFSNGLRVSVDQNTDPRKHREGTRLYLKFN